MDLSGDDLFTRTGLSDEIAVLRAAHPRPTWEAHPHLGEVARFWLERHRLFRELGGALGEGAAALAAGRAEPRAFSAWFVPRIRVFLGELHTHHAVEDDHYFPVFRAADGRLRRGFEILDGDHHAIDGFIHALADASNALSRALSADGTARREADALAAALGRTVPAIVRHLDDEEDLVVPLILERTEGGLGIG